MKKSHHSYNFCIFSFPSPFALKIFLKIGPPLLPNFLEFSFPIQKKEGLETMCLFPKMYEIVFVSFFLFPLEHFDFLKCFNCWLPRFFGKDFTTFLWPRKHQASNWSYPPMNSNKPMETLKIKQTNRLFSFWEVKIFWWFTHIGYKRTQCRISCVWHDFILHTI